MLTYKDVRASKKIRAYIARQDDTLDVLGYTEHSFGHVTLVAEKAGEIMLALGYSAHDAELAKIAGYMHDIGNVINRSDHANLGATLAFGLLNEMDAEPDDIATIISAIGNHDEVNGVPVNKVTAAVILADKGDVRRSRVRTVEHANFDIHDRVNYAVEHSTSYVEDSSFVLKLRIDTEICTVMDYFEIFLNRMAFSRRAAQMLGLEFRLIINDHVLV